jgi:hypothetical protein
MNVNSAYMFNVTNINFVLIYIKYMPIYSNFYIPGIVKSLTTANSAIVSGVTHS